MIIQYWMAGKQKSSLRLPINKKYLYHPTSLSPIMLWNPDDGIVDYRNWVALNDMDLSHGFTPPMDLRDTLDSLFPLQMAGLMTSSLTDMFPLLSYNDPYDFTLM